jgi:hypothetical protein
MLRRKVGNMGLGPLRETTLAQARLLAMQAKLQARRGINPIEARRTERLGAALAAVKTEL